MSTVPKLALGAAVVTAVALGGFMILRPPSTRPVVGVPGPTASPVTTADPSALPSIDASGWFRYTSEKYGFSAGVPSSYSVTPATSFWVVPETATTSWTEWDTFHDPIGATDFEGTSVRLPAGMTFDAWVAAYLGYRANPSAPPGDVCGDARNQPVLPITIDGHDASLRVGCDALEVLLADGDRVYTFGGWYHVDKASVLAPTDPLRRELEAWFTTIKLDPASALDPPAASPSPSPS